MDISNASLLIAASVASLTIVWFISMAAFNVPRNDFFHGEGKLTRSNVRANLAATATSLAGALFFFMEQIHVFGIILLAIPAFTVLGHWIFLRVVGSTEISQKNYGSIRRLVFFKTKSRGLANIANWL